MSHIKPEAPTVARSIIVTWIIRGEACKWVIFGSGLFAWGKAKERKEKSDSKQYKI